MKSPSTLFTLDDSETQKIPAAAPSSMAERYVGHVARENWQLLKKPFKPILLKRSQKHEALERILPPVGVNKPRSLSFRSVGNSHSHEQILQEASSWPRSPGR